MKKSKSENTLTNENIKLQKSMGCSKEVLRGKLIVLQAFLKKKKSQISSLTNHRVVNQSQQKEGSNKDNMRGNKIQTSKKKGMRTRRFFLKRQTKFINFQPSSPRREDTINKINERREITVNTRDIKKLPTNWMAPEKKGNFLKIYNLPRLNQEEPDRDKLGRLELIYVHY